MTVKVQDMFEKQLLRDHPPSPSPSPSPSSPLLFPPPLLSPLPSLTLPLPLLPLSPPLPPLLGESLCASFQRSPLSEAAVSLQQKNTLRDQDQDQEPQGPGIYACPHLRLIASDPRVSRVFSGITCSVHSLDYNIPGLRERDWICVNGTGAERDWSLRCQTVEL
uniref:Uncharacterized protein n=1 Tax=Knipowitschia caucasica TaxID=637954 RepID=A0AAV2KWS9_KNICA